MQHQFHHATECSAVLPGGWLRRILLPLRALVSRVDTTLALWHLRARSRRELQRLDDRLLRDIGADPSEAYKPFWRE